MVDTMDRLWRTVLWQQFGAAIDMLDNAMTACPDALWRQPIWPDPSAPSRRTEFWYVAYHALFWLDLYRFGSEEGFAPPSPLSLVEQDDAIGPLPDRTYSKEELRTYLATVRQHYRTTIATLTDEQARQPVNFGWMRDGEVVSYVELQLYSMRHIQEHAAQLSLLLGQHGVQADQIDWVTRAKDDLGGS
ncbi:MAG TPA: DinB family protein [Ktedonobacterales bacterium]